MESLSRYYTLLRDPTRRKIIEILGNHTHLLIGYPYFESDTLEHNPSIGVEQVTPWLPTNSVMILIGATAVIAIAIATVKIRRKSVNVVSVQQFLPFFLVLWIYFSV
jgi:hypothetical protein